MTFGGRILPTKVPYTNFGHYLIKLVSRLIYGDGILPQKYIVQILIGRTLKEYVVDN